MPILAEQPYAGYNNPYWIYLTCYHILATEAHPRAAPLLQQGYDLLQQNAALLDAASRQRFLTEVSIHRALVAAYEKLQAQRTKPLAAKGAREPDPFQIRHRS